MFTYVAGSWISDARENSCQPQTDIRLFAAGQPASTSRFWQAQTVRLIAAGLSAEALRRHKFSISFASPASETARHARHSPDVPDRRSSHVQTRILDLKFGSRSARPSKQQLYPHSRSGISRRRSLLPMFRSPAHPARVTARGPGDM
jgi:hypothetical protein